MAFTARTFDEILTDMVAYTKANTQINDFSIGSVARTILEAAALEDSEQYFQMQQLLEVFSINTATGKDLDDRLADLGLFRRGAKAATGTVRYGNSDLISEETVNNYFIGETIIQLFSTVEFPETYPFTIRTGESTSFLQDLIVTNNDIISGTLTLSTPLIKDLPIGSRVSYVDPAGSPITVGVGVQMQVPPSVGSTPRQYTSQEVGTILVGNYWSNEVLVRADQAGVAGNIAGNKITQFVGNSPFSGAVVANTSNTGGGLDRQTDDEFRQEGLLRIQSLSRGTPLALKTAAVGVTDSGRGSRVVSSSVREDFVRDEVVVYVDDGTGLVPDIVNIPVTSLAAAGTASDLTIDVADSSEFPVTGWILIEEDNIPNPVEVIEYNGKLGNTLLLETALANNHNINTAVNLVRIVEDAAEAAQERFRLPYFPVVRFSDRIWLGNAGTWTELVAGVDYILNRGTGEFSLLAAEGAPLNAVIVTNYDYYTNLIARVSRVLEGDSNDTVSFPGVKAAGIKLSVEAPSIRRISVSAVIRARPGVTESAIAPLVQANIEGYIRSLGVGEDVVRAKMIDVAYNTAGLADIVITNPTNNITILENELPLPFAADGDSLVTVS